MDNATPTVASDPVPTEQLAAAAPTTQEQLARFLPLYVVLSMIDGKVHGQVENSWSLSSSANRVRVYWSGVGYDNFFGHKHNIDGKADAEANANAKGTDGLVAFDAMASDCPIDIDWAAWLAATSKYDKRNAPFTVKSGEHLWRFRALAAEKLLAAERLANATAVEHLNLRLADATRWLGETRDKLDRIDAILHPPESPEADNDPD